MSDIGRLAGHLRPLRERREKAERATVEREQAAYLAGHRAGFKAALQPVTVGQVWLDGWNTYEVIKYDKATGRGMWRDLRFRFLTFGDGDDLRSRYVLAANTRAEYEQETFWTHDRDGNWRQA